MKQTAVEWLAIQVANFPTMENLRNNIKLVFAQAKEMEKQQIIDAWSDVGADGVTTAEEYYHINFKS
jgi:hypothetical protein